MPQSPLQRGAVLALGGVAILAASGLAAGFARRGSRSLDFDSLPAADKGTLCGAMSGLLAVLRAMHISIPEGHWLVAGPNSYSDHKLLERLYAGTDGGTALQEEIDGLGERIVTYCGPAFVDDRVVTRKALVFIDLWHNVSPSPVVRAQHAEEALQLAIRLTYDGLRAAGPVPLGLDDFLMALASAHDTNRYLLKQRNSPGPA